MKRRLPAEGKQKVDTALENWLGVALYRDEGGNDYLVSYGRGGDLGNRFCPMNYGSARLVAWVRPDEPVNPMISPLKLALQNRDPQIHRPQPAPARTVYPDIR
jgi:hypothetical protein